MRRKQRRRSSQRGSEATLELPHLDLALDLPLAGVHRPISVGIVRRYLAKEGFEPNLHPASDQQLTGLESNSVPAVPRKPLSCHWTCHWKSVFAAFLAWQANVFDALQSPQEPRWSTVRINQGVALESRLLPAKCDLERTFVVATLNYIDAGWGSGSSARPAQHSFARAERSNAWSAYPVRSG
jgi:hypothetical protein